MGLPDDARYRRLIWPTSFETCQVLRSLRVHGNDQGLLPEDQEWKCHPSTLDAWIALQSWRDASALIRY